MLQFTNATTPRRLRAVTHGRGIWEMTRDCASRVTLNKASYSCNETVDITVQESATGLGTLKVKVSSGAETKPETVTLTEFPEDSGHYTGSIRTTSGKAAAGDKLISVLNADQISVKYKDPDPCPGTPSIVLAKAETNCNACTGSGAKGPNLQALSASGSAIIQGGDADEFLDNCENGKVTFSVENIGATGLTNVRISKVTSSNSAIKLPALPVRIASSLETCKTAAADFNFTAAGLAPDEMLQLILEVTSNELAAKGITRSIEVQYMHTEQDFQLQATKTFGFENGMEGWTVANGQFNLATTGGGAGGTLAYLASSSLTDGVCDEARSPIVKLNSNSTLSLYNQYSTEPMTDAWYDRANVGIYDVSTGVRTNVAPGSGRTYLASGPNGVCVTGGQPGWAGPGPAWLQSSWSAADLKSAQFAGKKVQLDVGYGTDSSAALTGFWFDQVTLTNFEMQIADTHSNTCP
jgi:hypothetical protein